MNEYKVDEELEKKILELLLLGISTRKIRNILNIDYTVYTQIKESLKLKSKISDDKIKEAIEEREKRDKITIYKFLILGYNYVEIIATVPYGDKHYISKLVGELKKEGKITDREIEEYRFKRNEKHKKEIILQGLNQGLSCKEIADKYNEKYRDKHISEKNVWDYKNKLVEQGDITGEIIKEKRKEVKAKHIEPQEEDVLKLFGLGFNREQIKRIMNLTAVKVWRINQKLKDKGKITEEDIQYAITNRENEALKRRERIVKIINFTEDIDENLIKCHVEYLKAMSKLDELETKDIKLLRKVIPMSSKFVSFDNLNFILEL